MIIVRDIKSTGSYTGKKTLDSISVDSGGDGPHDGGMNERVARLEERFAATLPNLATKADVAALGDSIKTWMIATITGMMFGLAAIIFATVSSINAQLGAGKSVPAIPQPIIIQAAPASAPATVAPPAKP